MRASRILRQRLGGGVRSVVTDKRDKKSAMTMPPETTRVKIRSDFIKFANERDKS